MDINMELPSLYISSDIMLQKSRNNYFVYKCKDKTYKPNQYIGEEDLIMFKIAGMRVKIIDWQGRIIETINY